ncbi:MAG TPA: CTP synthase, partial [Rhizobiales bacterium]|nr:CTP synthase [Hyphomicrobiales bacterium]
PIPDGARKKIALFCNLRESRVIPALDVDTIYAVPGAYHSEGFDREVCAHFGLEAPEPELGRWDAIVNRIRRPESEVTIAIVGKYTHLRDSYKSLAEAMTHGGIANNVRVKLDWIDSEVFEAEEEAVRQLEGVHAILVPGGFGERGSEGKIEAARFAREREIPYFGICFGMQMAVIEAAREAGIEGASSTEFGSTEEPVIGLMTEWMKGNELQQRQSNGNLGGSMRLGAYEAVLAKGSKVAEIYGTTRISERHRHRYEVNMRYRNKLEAAGLRFSGLSPDGLLPEIVEVPDHPWFIGVQFHPELKSRPFSPHPLFASFIGAAVEQSRLV